MSEPQRPIRYTVEESGWVNRFAPEGAGQQPETQPTAHTPAYPQSASAEADAEGSEQVRVESAPSAQYANQAPSFPQRSGAAKAQKKGPGWGAFVLGLVITALVAVAAVMGIWGAQSPFSASANMALGQDGTTDSQALQQGSETVEPVQSSATAPDWEAVAAAVRPATVTIQVESDAEAASGSGVIIDSEGHLITNYHVVSGAINGGNITVALHDGRLYSAQIVGTDQTTDLAVLALDNPPSDLTAALLGDSSTLKVGQPVMAIGAPLGLADTVTTGVVSALDRPVSVQANTDSTSQQTEIVVTNAIQIDASINPGNSGGPLFNGEGAVVGINSSIASMTTGEGSAGSIGLGFAIPVNLASSVVTQILETGSAQHALLGVQISTATVVSGDSQRLGAQVAGVVDGGAAQQAGLAVGDVIVGIDGNSVTSGPALTGYVRRYTAGDEVTLDVVRNGENLAVPVILQQK